MSKYEHVISTIPKLWHWPLVKATHIVISLKIWLLGYKTLKFRQPQYLFS